MAHGAETPGKLSDRIVLTPLHARCPAACPQPTGNIGTSSLQNQNGFALSEDLNSALRTSASQPALCPAALKRSPLVTGSTSRRRTRATVTQKVKESCRKESNRKNPARQPPQRSLRRFGAMKKETEQKQVLETGNC